MSVTQYIGARYVPLFEGEWSIDRAYEPLSVVSNEGNSYTSRQAVPIGVELTNETYWAPTGIYNAQIEAYRREVLAFDGRISALEASQEEIESIIAEMQARMQTFENETNEKIAELRELNKSRGDIDERVAYISAQDGDDETAELNNRQLPFKTLDAAYDACDEVGNDIRFFFLTPGEYTITARVYVGIVWHFDTRFCSGDVNVTMDNLTTGGGLFLYDSHINFNGNDFSKIHIRTTANYLQCEGSVFTADYTTFRFNGQDFTSRAKGSGYIVIYGGGFDIRFCEIFGKLEIDFTNGRLERLALHHTSSNSAAFNLVSSICRIQGDTPLTIDSSETNSQPAVRAYTSFFNMPDQADWAQDTASLGYLSFLATYTSLVIVTEQALNKFNEWSETKCAINSLANKLNPQV